MTLIQALILGLAQGLTEFIPVSSSGHLILLHQAMGITSGGLTFDVALHLGTLLALIVFFYRDIVALAVSLFKKTTQTRLAWLLIVATIPAVIAGSLLENAAENAFRSASLVAVSLGLVAIIMLFAERYNKRQQQHTALQAVSNKQALAMGIAQAAAIIPGVSRSGATITTGLFVGMNRIAATRFSFLLAIPITVGAIGKVLLKGSAYHQISSESGVFIVGMLTAFLSGLFAIRFLLAYLSKHSLAVFAYYRIALSIFVLAVLAFT